MLEQEGLDDGIQLYLDSLELGQGFIMSSIICLQEPDIAGWFGQWFEQCLQGCPQLGTCTCELGDCLEDYLQDAQATVLVAEYM